VLIHYFPVLKGLALQVIIIETAMSTAFNAMFLARELDGDYEKPASPVLLTTFLSVLSIPVFLYLLQFLDFYVFVNRKTGHKINLNMGHFFLTPRNSFNPL